MSTETAHLAWDATWQTDEGRAAWSRPEADIVAFAATARISGAARALDLGCGVGRHALALARLGFTVDAVDASPQALARTKAAAGDLPVTVHAAAMTALPFEEAAFDVAVAWHVIYHGDPQVVAQTVAELARVTAPGGRVVVTMLTKRDAHFGIGREVAPDTFVDDSATDDKVHPHHYCDAEGFAVHFRAFHVLTLREDSLGRPGRSHFVATLQRKS
jgi:SAM-dependent methyltransferase